MTRSRTDYRWRVSIAAGLVTALVLVGCRSFRPMEPLAAPSDSAAVVTADGEPGTPRSSQSETNRARQPELTDTLADDGWIQTSGDAAPGWTAAGPRWRHPAFEELLAAGGERPDWSRYLDDANPVVAASAAILLARQHDVRGLDVLAKTVRSRPLEMRIRQAAAEALMWVRGPSAVKTLQALVDQYGGLDSQTPTSYIADLHAELIRSLARHVSPEVDSRFEQALRSSAAQVRLAALAAFADTEGVVLPQQVVDLRFDPDPNVRAAALELIGARRVERALDDLRAGLHDYDGSVRLAAVRGLGRHGGEDARSELTDLLQNGTSRMRAAAVEALATLAAEADLLAAADDDAWRVRRTVAEMLSTVPFASGPSSECRSVMDKLLSDRSPLVQEQAVATLAHWPLDIAGPSLMAAMESSGYRARVAAATDLALRWSPGREFSPDASASRRTAALANLRQLWNEEHAEGIAAETSATPARFDPFDDIEPDDLALVEEALGWLESAQQPEEVHRQALEQLNRFGEDLVALVEYVAVEKKRPLPEVVYREVLPQHSEVFAALDRLASSEAAQHRQAATHLARLAGEQSLRPLAVARLAQLVETEADPLVWQSVLGAIAADGSEPSIYLAYAAISHGSPEVRRQACEHLTRHADPRHGDVLLPALADSHPAVAQAAIRAVAESGARKATGTLEELLASSNRQTRLEAARGLARLRSGRGIAALERLAYDSDPAIRIQAAVAMGELGEPTFAPALVRMLDDPRLGVRRAALGSLRAVVGRDVATEQETQDSSSATSTPSIDEAIYRWKHWWDREGSTALRGTSTAEQHRAEVVR